jgi:outer membrane cobalamin receptor
MTAMFGADPEEADNMELGVRYSEGTTNIEVFYFQSDYERLAAECTLVSGASCNADESAVLVVVKLKYQVLSLASWMLQGDNGVMYPISGQYIYKY